MLLLLTLLACTSSVRRDFDATLTAATADPPPLEADWRPDASVRIGARVVEQAIGAAVQAADLTTTLSVAGVTVSPRLDVERFRLAEADEGCPSCLRVGGTLAGKVSYQALGFKGEKAVKVTLVADTSLGARKEQDGWSIFARAPAFKKIRTEIPLLDTRIADLVISPIASWLTSTVADQVGELRVARLGELDAPLQALAVTVDDGTVEVRARTSSSWRAGVPPAPAPDDGWAVRIATRSVIDMARRAVFEQGSLGFGVWAEPRDLVFEDERFTLDLRIWRVSGLGWWRDYRVEGDVVWTDQALALTNPEVTEVARSQGAGWVDPIAALAQGKVLKLIGAAVSTSLPSSRTEDVGGVRVAWALSEVHRDGDDLVATGTARFDVIGR